MAKIVVECSDPNDLNEVEAIMDQVAGRCNITYFKQHQGMVDAGTSKSKSESSRKIAEDTGETPEAVRHRIKRGEKESGQVGQMPPSDQESDQDPWPICNVCDKNRRVEKQRTGKPAKHGMCKRCRETYRFKKRGIDPESERYWQSVSKKIDNLKKRIQRNFMPPTTISDKCKEGMVESLEMFIATLSYFEKEVPYGWKK